MPYNKPYRKRYKGYRRRRVKGGNIFYRRLGNKSRWMAKKLRMLNVEYKNKYTQLTASATGTTPAFFSLVNMIKGDDDNLRQGNQIKCVTIYMNALIRMNTSATSTTLRYVIFLDKQCNGVNATAPELFQDNTVTDIMISPLNPDNKFRFQILYNNLVRLSPEHPTAQVKFFKRVSIPIRYSGNAGTAADLTSNNILVLLFSDEATNTPTVTHNIRMSYVDN